MKPDSDMPVKAETQTKTEIKTEIRTEYWPKSETDTKPNDKATPKPDDKAAPAPGNESDAKPDDKSDAKPSDKTDGLKTLAMPELFKKLGSSADGLTQAEATKRLTQYGPNAIAEKKSNAFLKFLSYFWGPIPWMIEAAVITLGRRPSLA